MRKYRRKKYKKHYRIRRKKSLFRSWFFWLGVLVLVIFGGIIYLFIFSSVFQIKEIKISGNIKVSAEEIRNIISNNTKNIFLANLKKIDETLLENFPQIEKVNLNRDFPDVLAAQIEERKPVAIFSQYGDCFFIDKQGVIFERVSEVPQMLKIKKSEFVSGLELGKEVIKEEQMDQILKIKDNLTIPLEEILIVSEKRLNALTSEGWEIYFNPERDLDWQLRKLEILLKEKIPPEKRGNLEYIDLRFEKIYIFPENY